MKSARLFLLPFLALIFLGMAKKPAITVRFHAEANVRDGETFAMPVTFHNPERAGHVERVPSLSERDIRGIYPTTEGDGTFGCAFYLNAHGRLGLQTLSTERRGTMLTVFIGTKGGLHQVADILVDKPMTDGIIYVPRGLTQLEIEALGKQFPVMGQTAKRK